MIVPDVNLLLDAHVKGFAEHPKARRWWEDLMNGSEEVGLGGPAVFGFIRPATSPRVLDRPLRVGEALARVEDWMSRRHVRFAMPGPRHLEIAFGLLMSNRSSASEVANDCETPPQRIYCSAANCR